MTEQTKTSPLQWRGIAEGESRIARLAGLSTLALTCIAMVAMQLNYIVVGDAHMIVVLAPITVCALLYGTVPGAVTGLLAGLAELLHATLLPMDYYEKYFMAPTNSVLLFGLVGLLMGVLFASIDHQRDQDGWKRPAALVCCCAAGSLFFTLFFHLSAYLINSLLALELPTNLLQQLTGRHEVFSQWLADLGVMAPLALAVDALNKRRVARGSIRTIRETFQRWLAVVMIVAYLICGALAYTGISLACRGYAEREMSSYLAFIADQLATRDRMIDAVSRRTALSQRVLDEVHATSIAGVTEGFVLGEEGISVVAENGTIVSTNVAELLGSSFEEVVGAGLRDGFDSSLYDAPRSTEWNMGGGTLGYVRMSEVGYVRVAQSGSYQLMVAMSAADMFYFRTLMMVVVSAAFLVIFVAVYVQASVLLQNVVVRGFDETNEVLSRITEGDLTQVVDVRDSVEFNNLSGGINATVGALKDSIAEAEARIDRELKTAKAIQENALPNTFPPFPDIEEFDIYASMNAAKEVGGDFYDFFLINDHTLGFLIADVSGKGIPAALFMMAAKTEVGNYMQSGIALADAVQSANYHLCQGNEAGMFVTMWAATLDYKTGELTYVNAGHNPPLMRRDGQWQWLRQRGGLFLGTFDMATYHSERIKLKKDDLLLLYTDGVTEGFSAHGEQYGEERLERFVTHHAAFHPHALVDAMRSELYGWEKGVEQSDDITLLALEYGVSPEVSGTMTVTATLENLERITAFIHAELGKRLCPIAVQNQIDIALEELYVNIARYAYAHLDSPGQCRVDYVYNANPSSMTIQLTDQGIPFDPLTREDPTKPSSIQEAKVGGLGILMAKRSVDDLSYVRDGDSNVVAFKKVW